METPDQVGDLHLISKSRTGAVYTSFNAFEFDHVWSQFQKLGATSCNVIPDGDTDSVTFEVYYPDVQNSQRKHTRCQWALLGICSICHEGANRLNDGDDGQGEGGSLPDAWHGSPGNVRAWRPGSCEGKAKR